MGFSQELESLQCVFIVVRLLFHVSHSFIVVFTGTLIVLLSKVKVLGQLLLFSQGCEPGSCLYWRLLLEFEVVAAIVLIASYAAVALV